jgi:hypothetical protein
MANVTITQLPQAGAITGTESVPIVQNGVTVQTTTGAIANSPTQTQTFLTKNQELTLPNSRYLSTGTGLGLTDGGALSYYRITLNGVSGSLETAGTGIVVKDSGNSVIARQIAVSGAGLGVSNADGTSGNPTLQLTGVAAGVANYSGTGFLAVVGGSSVAGRQIYGTANQIDVANGNGSNDPVIKLSDNAILPGNASVTIPIGTTAQQPLGQNGQFRFNSDTQTFDGYASGAWRSFGLTGGVISFSGGTTGLTPSIPSGGAIALAGTLSVDNGGTGTSGLTGYIKGNGASVMSASATIPSSDVTGLGTIASQNANNVAITGGTASGVAITGGSVNNAPIGGVTPSTGAFTSIAINSGTVASAPTTANDIVNKSYVDGISAGINFHQSCRLATVVALPANTYNNGTSGVGATLTANANGALSVDSTPVVVGNRVLVKNEANGAYNGVYTVTATGGAGAPYVLTRATDYDTAGAGVNQINSGDFFLITGGSTNTNTSWVQQTPLPITVGTTAIVFTQFAAPVLYSAGTGLNLAVNTFNISDTTVTAGAYGGASSVATFSVNAQGQLTAASNTAIAISSAAVSGLAASATTDTTNAANITSGILPSGRLSGTYNGITGVDTLTSGIWNATTIGVAYGGTGLTTTPSNGNLLIGNGSGYALGGLTAGAGITITNGAGSITVANNFNGTVTSVDISGGTTGLSFSGGPITTSGTITAAGTLNVANGGTGAISLTGYVKGNGTSAMSASATIPNTDISGLGTMSTQNANSVAITGGSVNGATIGASVAATGVFTNLTATSLTGYVKGNGASVMTASATIPNTDITGLGTMSTQNANGVVITGGSVNGTSIGASTASTGAFTTLSASSLIGYVKGNGASVMTASSTIPSSDITGLGTMSTQNANNVTITGGSIDGVAIGATTASTGIFTTLTATGGISGGTF